MKHFFVSLLLIMTFAACKGDEVVNVISELPKGTLQGTVFLTSNDTAVYDLDGVTVQLEGTNLKTVTDKFGRWKIDNVPSRTYNIYYEKEGFGYTKLYSFGFLGGVPVTVPQQYLFKIPSCAPVFDNVIVMDTTQFQLNTHTPCGNNVGQYYFVFFLSNKPNVSYEPGKYQFSVIAGSQGTNPATINVNAIYFQPGYPYASSGLNIRDSIYAVAYAMGGYTGVTDPFTQEMIHPSLRTEPSRRLAFKLPFDR